MKVKKRLTEEVIYQSPREIKLKKEIQAYLIDDGFGHHHAKYAKRLNDMYVNIVDADTDPNYTAAVDFDKGVIYIGEAFAENDFSKFKQISVLIRHELAHNLLMHQTKMMRIFKQKYGDIVSKHFRWDSSIHELLNIIEDFEISNRVYTKEDKYIVTHMKNVIQTICGLVTEEHRNWSKMSLEQMYDELSKEIEENDQRLLGLTSDQELEWINGPEDNDDILKRSIKQMYSYKTPMKYSSINSPIKDFMKRETYSEWPDTFKEIVESLLKEFSDVDNLTLEEKNEGKIDKNTIDKIETQIKLIRASRPLEKVTICDSIDLYTPVEKLLAIEVLKNLLGQVNQETYRISVEKAEHSKEYVHYYNQIIDLLDDKEKYPTLDLYRILNKLNGNDSSDLDSINLNDDKNGE